MLRSTRSGVRITVAAVVLAAGSMVGVASVTSAQESGSEGAASSRIVGGKQTRTESHPHVVYLADRDEEQFCGGALIAETKVVTAAHCVAGASADRIRVVAGRDDVRSDSGTVARVRSIWIPDTYRSVTEGSDVAVVHLSRKLPYGTIAIADGGDGSVYASGTMATVFGWGRTSETGESSNTLRSADVPVRADKVCANTYRDYKPAEMVCAGYPGGGVDACQGDSGGPLIAGDRLIGVVSWGEGCARAGKPGVYTEIRAYADQIRASKPTDAQPDTGGGITLPLLGGDG